MLGTLLPALFELSHFILPTTLWDRNFHCLHFVGLKHHVVVHVLSRVQFFVTPRTVAHQDPLAVEFYRQEYWSELPLPIPGDLPDPGTELESLHLLHGQPFGKPKHCAVMLIYYIHLTEYGKTVKMNKLQLWMKIVDVRNMILKECQILQGDRVKRPSSLAVKCSAPEPDCGIHSRPQYLSAVWPWASDLSVYLEKEITTVWAMLSHWKDSVAPGRV